ncbi:hypothetical protein COBT_001050, partial [Conglomerata obtusa]
MISWITLVQIICIISGMGFMEPSVHISFDTIKKSISRLKKQIKCEKIIYENAMNEYVFFSFASDEEILKKKMINYIFSVFSMYSAGSKAKFMCFDNVHVYEDKTGKVNDYLYQMFQIVCNLHLNSDINHLKIDQSHFETYLEYTREIIEISESFFQLKTLKGYNTLYLSNCDTTKADFNLSYNIFSVMNYGCTFLTQRYNYFFVFKKPCIINKTSGFCIDLQEIMNFTNEDRTFIEFEYAQMNLNSYHKFPEKETHQIGYHIYSEKDNNINCHKKCISANLGVLKPKLMDKILFSYRLEFYKVPYKYKFDTTTCIQKLGYDETFYKLKCRTQSGLFDFIFIVSKHKIVEYTISEIKKGEEFFIQCTSIYYINCKEYICYGRFFNYITGEGTILSITDISNANFNNYYKNQTLAKKFLINLEKYLKRDFVSVGNFHQAFEPIINYYDHFWHCKYEDN